MAPIHWLPFFVVSCVFFPRMAWSNERSNIVSILTDDPTKILLVGAKLDHPYASHMYEFECSLLAKALRNTPGVEAITIPAWPPADLEALGDVRAIVFYASPVGHVVLSPTNRERFVGLMKNKVGMVAIHWATGVGYDKAADSEELRDEYKSILGGWFRRPPCDVIVGQAHLRQVAAGHPIYNGWREWEIRDEFYLNPVLHEQAAPLLEVTVDDKKHVVGWTFERANSGRSVGITLGHFHHNFAREDFRRLLVNSILWAANVAVPDSGATVTLDWAATELPAEKATAAKDAEPMPHPDALSNPDASGEVDKPELVPFIIQPRVLPGIVVDETDATLDGQWEYSTHTPPYVGLGYLHDKKTGKGESSVTYTPDLPSAGVYEVRLSHCYNARRATNTPVTVHHAAGETTVRINQQEAPEHDRLFRSIGQYEFQAGSESWVRISTAGTAGKYVVADAVQFIPVK